MIVAVVSIPLLLAQLWLCGLCGAVLAGVLRRHRAKLMIDARRNLAALPPAPKPAPKPEPARGKADASHLERVRLAIACLEEGDGPVSEPDLYRLCEGVSSSTAGVWSEFQTSMLRAVRSGHIVDVGDGYETPAMFQDSCVVVLRSIAQGKDSAVAISESTGLSWSHVKVAVARLNELFLLRKSNDGLRISNPRAMICMGLLWMLEQERDQVFEKELVRAMARYGRMGEALDAMSMMRRQDIIRGGEWVRMTDDARLKAMTGRA